MFEIELKYFIDNQEDLVRRYRGKVLVITGNKIQGIYNSALEAYFEAQIKLKPGSFMIQTCEPGPEAYTVNITSQKLVL